MNINNDILLSRLEQLCAEQGISLNAAFVESGVGKNFKSNLKTSNPSMGKITMLANYFGVAVDYLIGKTDSPDYEEKNFMFWNNFVNLCNNKGKSPNGVCAALGYSTAIATKWKNGAVPRDTTLKKIADYFDVPVSALTENSPAPEIHSNAIILDPTKTRMIRVYESVSAGFGAMAQDLVVDYMPIYIHSDSEADETICIKVTGDSMSPEIENGDIIQVHKQSSVDNGSIAVVLVDDDEALVKKVTYGTDYIELHSLNPAYPTLRFEKADLMRIRILGLVKNTIKSPHPHRLPTNLDSELDRLADGLSPAELQEVKQFIKYLHSKKQE